MNPEWEKLPAGVREQWKIDPKLVLKVTRKPGTVESYVALTATHRYTWTYLRQRMDFVVSKSVLK